MRWFVHEKIVRHHVDVHIHSTGGDVSELKSLLQLVLGKVNAMSVELDNLETEVSETRTVVDSAIVLLRGLKAALDAAGADPAKLAALSASLDSQQQDLAAAVAANTPAQP